MTESLLSLESVSRIYGTDVEVHALNEVEGRQAQRGGFE